MAKSKRIQKKKQKQQQQKTLSAKYTPKQQKRMTAAQRSAEEKKIVRAEKKKQTRAATREKLRAIGLPDKFISENRLNDRQFKSFTSQELLILRKQAELERAGYQFKKSDLRLGWLKLREKFPDISIPEKAWKNPPKLVEGSFRANEFLYIGAAQVRGGFHVEDFSSLTASELKDHINDRIKEAKEASDDSASMYCVFVYYAGSYGEVMHAAEVFYDRGYKFDANHVKLDQNQYQKLVINDTWTEHRFLSMTYNVINQMKNEDIFPFIKFLKRYCRYNSLPFMRGID